MNISIKNARVGSYDIIWAVAASMLLHILVGLTVPNFDFSAPKELKQVIKVELVKSEPPAPEPIVEPLPPIEIPEPPKPKPVEQKPKPIPKPTPIKQKAPEPIAEPEPEVTPPPVVDEVIAVAPTVAAPPPEVVVPQPPPPVEPLPPEPVETVPLGPSDAELRAARDSYKSAIKKLIKNKIKLSKLAEKRRLEGTSYITIEINVSGEIVNTYLCKSSGYATLDKSALNVFKSLSNLPVPKYFEIFSLSDNKKTTCTEDITIQKGNHRINVPIAFKNSN